MAITVNYEHDQTMKKLSVNGSIYWLKDADLRALVESFGTVVYKDVETTLTEDGVNVVATSKAVADWVKEKIKDLAGAMHFRGVVKREEGESDAEAIARTITDPTAGDVVVMSDNGKEYIYQGAAWEEVGDQNIYLTIATAAATYVPKTTTIAGIDLQDSITVEELSASTALDLKALSHKDSASGSIDTVDSINDITSGKAGTYTVAGDTVAVPVTYSALDVTPAGTVTVTADVAAAVSYAKATSTTVSSIAADADHPANYTPAGTVALPTFTSTVTPTKEAVATVTDAGTAYSLTAGSVTKADDATAKFVQKAVKMAIDADDAEQLNLTYVANTDTEFYSDAVTGAGAVTYVAPALTGKLPTFGTKDVLTNATVATAKDAEATFSGAGAVIAAAINTTDTAATVTQPTYTAAFAGTDKSVTPEVATTANAQAPSGTVTVASETIQITPVKSSKTVTVK
jgi:signal peptidase I